MHSTSSYITARAAARIHQSLAWARSGAVLYPAHRQWYLAQWHAQWVILAHIRPLHQQLERAAAAELEYLASLS